MKLLIIRPQFVAEATAERSKQVGFEPIIMPLFAVEPSVWNAPDPLGYDALMITSANAIRYGAGGLKALQQLPVYAVGSASGQAAQDAGFSVVAKGKGGATDCLNQIDADGLKRILWLTGEDHIQPEIPQTMQVDRVIVYKSAALPAPENFHAILAQHPIVALHSPRAARYFAQLCDDNNIDRSNLCLAVLSPAIAIAVGENWRHIAVAEAPNDTALLSAAKLCFTSLHRGS
jgi:uroporphyrinogen-III synthase